MKAIKQTSGWKKYGMTVGGVWGVWLILTAAIYCFALGPQNVLMARLQKEFVSSNEDYSLAQTAGRPETRAKMEQKLQDVSQKTGYFIVPQEKSSGLLLQISQLASKNQVQEFTSRTVNASSASKKEDQTSITQAWMELEFTGTFPQIASFINSLERNDPVVFVENINLRRGTQQDDLPTATIQISYYTDAPKTEKSKATPKQKVEAAKNKEAGK
jgi:hypothetical protein